MYLKYLKRSCCNQPTHFLLLSNVGFFVNTSSIWISERIPDAGSIFEYCGRSGGCFESVEIITELFWFMSKSHTKEEEQGNSRLKVFKDLPWIKVIRKYLLASI